MRVKIMVVLVLVIFRFMAELRRTIGEKIYSKYVA
jgi:hypothetical protein